MREKHFSIFVFVTIIVGGSMAVLTFADFLLLTFAPNNKTNAESAVATTIEAVEPIIVVEENVYERNIVDNALLELYKSAIVINQYQEFEIIDRENSLNQTSKGYISRSLSLPTIPQPSWFPSNIFITIDDGPRLSNNALQEILSVLNEFGVHAYFFFVGDNIQANLNRDEEETKTILQQMVRDGHIIGWHSMHHRHIATAGKPRLDQQPAAMLVADIKEFESLVTKTLERPYNTNVSRMPGGFGTYDANIIQTFINEGIRPPTFWHIETAPWETQVRTNKESYVKNLLSKKDDYIILLHEYAATGQDLRDFLTEVKRQNSSLANNNIEDTVIEKTSSTHKCPKPTVDVAQDLEPISRTHSISSTYTPPNLVPITGDWSTYCIKEEVHTALTQMIADAAKDGHDIEIYSGYRSYGLQSTLYKNWQARNPNGALYPAVAEPGHSEHQLGTTVDLKSGKLPYGDSNPFGESEEYQWMKEHAHKYGFVQSYPEGKSEITGYIPEPWHWRYLGKEIASDIKKRGITITEYLQEN